MRANMRFRFSLRWLLILFVFFGMVFYFFFVRPTVIAHGFASAIQYGDVRRMQSFFPSSQTDKDEFDNLVYQDAEVREQTWEDVRNFRRRVVVNQPDQEGGPDSQPIKVHFEAGLFHVRYIQHRQIVMNPNPSN